jgi:hypothetical protein
MKEFADLVQVPDLVPQALLLPPERADLRVPQLDDATPTSTTPLEVGYIIFSQRSWLVQYRERLQNHLRDSESAPEFLKNTWMNHLGRAVVRAGLDPDRTAPIDMFQVYKNELNMGARFPAKSEEDYFKNFVETNGVFERVK